MKLTKYEHACIVLEDQNASLIIDPGALSSSFTVRPDVVGVVITHQHPDHLSEETLQQIIAANPEAKIFSTQDVADTHTNLPIHIVHPSDIQQIGPFTLGFSGGDHATIHSATPVVQNIGVCVNDSFYYPGDSFTLPHKDIAVLAVPAAAPWLKVQEAMDYITAVKATLNIPTHDAVLSSAGQTFHDMWLKQAAEQSGNQYKRLEIGETIEV